MHISDLERLISAARARGENVQALRLLGDPPPSDEEARPQLDNSFVPKVPHTIEETGLNRTFLTEHFLRILYNKGRATGREIAATMGLLYQIIEPIITDLRNVEQIDIIGQKPSPTGNRCNVLILRPALRYPGVADQRSYRVTSPVSLSYTAQVAAPYSSPITSPGLTSVTAPRCTTLYR